jgi:hypothetical protein
MAMVPRYVNAFFFKFGFGSCWFGFSVRYLVRYPAPSLFVSAVRGGVSVHSDTQIKTPLLREMG